MVFWIPLLLAGAQMVETTATQEANAKAANKAQRKFESNTLQFANQDLIASFAAISARRLQERHSLDFSVEQVTKEASRRTATASVSAGESGVRGHSVQALLDDFKITQLQSIQNAQDTEQYAQEQYGRDVAAVRSQAQERILQAKQQRVPGPNYLQNFLTAVGSYYQMTLPLYNANKMPLGDIGADSSSGGSGQRVGGIPANAPNSGLVLPGD